MEERNIYITHLFDATKNVNSKYLIFNDLSFKKEDVINVETPPSDIIEQLIDKQIEENNKTLERNFCYELYRNWRGRINNNGGEHYKNLVINGEIGKINIINVIKNFEQLGVSLNLPDYLKDIKNKWIYPDLTLHGGNNDIHNQKLIVEVKRKENLSPEKLKSDLKRLILYKRLYNFEMVVFIALNTYIKDFLMYLEGLEISEEDKQNFFIIFRGINYCHNVELIELL